MKPNLRNSMRIRSSSNNGRRVNLRIGYIQSDATGFSDGIIIIRTELVSPQELNELTELGHCVIRYFGDKILCQQVTCLKPGTWEIINDFVCDTQAIIKGF